MGTSCCLSMDKSEERATTKKQESKQLFTYEKNKGNENCKNIDDNIFRLVSY